MAALQAAMRRAASMSPFRSPWDRKSLPLPWRAGSSRCFVRPLASDGSLHQPDSGGGSPAAGGCSPEFRKCGNGGGLCHESARVDPTALVEVGAVVHAEAMVGADVRLGSGAVVGPFVSVGHSTTVGYNTSLSNCTVGSSCIIHHGACVGQDGFGFLLDEEGCVVKKPQKLLVMIGNNVEIGASTCIDRGSWRDTVIGDHSKIDNLVQIAHNVVIGKGCIICGQVGIAGSVTLGDYVVMGGRAMIRDHVSIVSKVRIAANSGVTKNIISAGDYGGFPAVPIHEWRRQVTILHRLCEKVATRS